jgi:hypothetical protein
MNDIAQALTDELSILHTKLKEMFGEEQGYLMFYAMVEDINQSPLDDLLASDPIVLSQTVEFTPPDQYKVLYNARECDLTHCLKMVEKMNKHFKNLFEMYDRGELYGFVGDEIAYLEDIDRLLKYGNSPEFLVDRDEVKESRYYKDLKLAFIKSCPERSIYNFDPYSDPTINALAGRDLIYKIAKVLTTEYLLKVEKEKAQALLKKPTQPGPTTLQ